MIMMRMTTSNLRANRKGTSRTRMRISLVRRVRV
jgi:hypothetical protein